MAGVFSMALIERRGRVLVVQRKVEATPFPNAWLLPTTIVSEGDSAEEALEAHGQRDLNVQFAPPQFAETLSIVDEADGGRYVANVFRVSVFEGELRFRAASDYQDARWLTSDELSSVAMPDTLREWLQEGRFAPEAPKIAAVVAGASAPDNRAAWNTISRAYQDRYEIPTDHIEWGPRCPDLDDELLGDVSGKRVVVIGCGGGQDCIVLAKHGAQVVGIDLSDKQIEYGRRLVDREGVVVTLLQGSAEHLKEVEDATQDLAISAHAFNYVERADRALAEVFRVLKPGSPFALSVGHPFNATLAGGAPYEVKKSYWDVQQDWQWEFAEKNATGRFRSWDRTVSEWFALLTNTGFRVDGLLEPRTVDEGDSTWDGSYDREKMRLIPTTLILKATKP